MTQAAVYLRQSLDKDQTELGIKRQRNECDRLCKQRGWRVSEVITDNSVSASKHGRPGYTRLLELIKSQAIDVVVILRVDRLLRLNDELEELLQLSERTGIKVATVEGDVDLTTPQGRLIARILVSVARNEMEVKAARHKLANQQKAMQGRPHGSKRLFGYEPDLVTMIPSEAAVVREMGRRVMGGHSYYDVADWLNGSGQFTPSGAKWYAVGVKRLLSRQHYAGIRNYKGTEYPGAWTPVFDRDEWEALQLTIRLRAEEHRKFSHSSPKYLLTGLVFCGVCGEPMTGCARYDGKPGVGPYRRAYICRGPQHDRYRGCGGTRRNAEALDYYIKEIVLYRLDTPELAKLLSGDSKQLQALLEQRRLQQVRIEALVDDYATGLLDRTQLQRAKATAEAELQRLDGELLSLKRERRISSLNVEETLREAWERNPDSWRRELLGLVIKRIDVLKGQRGKSPKLPNSEHRLRPELIQIHWTD